MKRTKSDAATTNDWSFSLRTNPAHWHSSEGDLSDSEEEYADPSAQEKGPRSTQKLLGDLDLSTREDHAIFKPNPWSIAKINASSSSSRVPSVKQSSGPQASAINPSHTPAGTSKEQEALKRAFQRQSARPAANHGSSIIPATLGHVMINQEPAQFVRSQVPAHNLSDPGRDVLYGNPKILQFHSNTRLESHPSNQVRIPAGTPSASLSSVNTNRSPRPNRSQTLITAHIPTKKQAQLRSSTKLLTPSLLTDPSRHASSLTSPSSSVTFPEAPSSQHIISELRPHHALLISEEGMSQIRSNADFYHVGRHGLSSEKSPGDTPHKLLHTQPYLCTPSSYTFCQPSLSHSNPLTDRIKLFSPDRNNFFVSSGGSNVPYEDQPVDQDMSDDPNYNRPAITPSEESTKVLVPRPLGDMPDWLAATLPPWDVGTPPSKTDYLADGTRSSGCRSPDITITALETSRGSKRRRLSHNSSRPASLQSSLPSPSPSPSPPHPYRSIAAPPKPTLDLDAKGSDLDASWSTLPSKTKKKDNNKRDKPIRRSGLFCLPGLSTTSKPRAGLSLAAEKYAIHNRGIEPTLHKDKRTRVITYLPPPPVARPPSSSAAGGGQRWVQKKSGGESGMIASSDDRHPDMSDEDMHTRSIATASARFKRPPPHDAYEFLSSESARGSSSSPLRMDVNIQIDEYAVGEQYPHTVKVMRQ